jgi:hypothetical protein
MSLLRRLFRLRSLLLAVLLVILASVAMGCSTQRNLSPKGDVGFSPTSAPRLYENESR